MQELPTPATSTEMYLAAVLDELRALRAERAAPGSQPSNPNDQAEIPIREPAKRAPAKRAKKPTEG